MTTRGRTLAVLAVAMLAFGRLTGLRELVMAGAAFALMLAAGAAVVWLRRGEMHLSRGVVPSRTQVGREVRVELTIEAAGFMGAGPVLLADRVPAALGPTPRLALPGGARVRRRSVAYTLIPRMRGRHEIGPLEVTHTDPFACLRRQVEVADTNHVVVYPSFEEVSALPGNVQRVGTVKHSPMLGGGDEFYSLRAYEEGDDLRKIHWPSTFRTGELFIRQDELLAEPKALIVLDTSASKHRGRGANSSLEAAVSVCASLGVLALRRRMRLDVVTTDGPLMSSRSPDRHELLEALATVKTSKQSLLTPALTRSMAVVGSVRPALVVVITPDLRSDEAQAVAVQARRTPAGAVVWVDASSFGTARKARRPAVAGTGMPVVPLRAGDSFRHAWHNSIRNVPLAR